MWLLTLLLLVSATSACAQWQTRVDVTIYSITDADYANGLRLIRSEAKKHNNMILMAKIDFLLSQQDPVGYKEFVLLVNKKISDWVRSEVEKGKDSKLQGKFASVVFSPYSLNTHKEVQVMITESLELTEIGVNINDGVDKVFNMIKNVIMGTPTITPTSTKRSI